MHRVLPFPCTGVHGSLRPSPGHFRDTKWSDMARSTRSPKLETRTARLKSAARKKPYFVAVAPGVGLGYRRNKTAGSWVLRVADGKGGNWTQVFAVADDFEDANGTDVLSFWQAQDRARLLARGGSDSDDDGGKPVTVAQMI